MKIAVFLLGILAAFLVAFALWPAPIDSRGFSAPPSSRPSGPWAANRALESCERIASDAVQHADKLLVDDEGRVYAGDDRGRILRLSPGADGVWSVETFAEPGGRPMELDFDPQGRIVGADLRGPHFRIDAEGKSERLPTLEGLPIGTAGAAVSRSGELFYGAHTERYSDTENLEAFYNMLAARPTSELRSFDPETGRETTLVEGLWLPVGVELSADEDFVAVAEFFAYRVTRYWLAGPKAGSSDRLIEGLPGFVDGLASDGRGTFYVSLPGYRAPVVDWLHGRPWMKDQLAKLLPLLLGLGLQPEPSAGIVIALDEAGRVLRSFQDPKGKVVGTVTDVHPHDGDLYLTSIAGSWVARCPIGD